MQSRDAPQKRFAQKDKATFLILLRARAVEIDIRIWMRCIKANQD